MLEYNGYISHDLNPPLPPPPPHPHPYPSAHRDPAAHRDPDDKPDQKSMRIYRIRQSRAWKVSTAIAVLAYMAACFLGKPPFSASWDTMPRLSAMQDELGQAWGLWLEIGCVLFFSFDIYLLCGWVVGA